MGKQEIREHVWQALREAGVARFPGARGRIPNFTGAEQAAEKLGSLALWNEAQVLKCNPDLPQRPVRWRALKEGKTVYMAVPRLTSMQCFVELEPESLGRHAYAASSIKGAFQFGRPVTLDEMRPIDLVVCGSVAVTRSGSRLGKGGGYSDLEYALAREAGLLTADTPITTTVHPLQMVDSVPLTAHDIPLDCFVTPDEIVSCTEPPPRPQGIHWDELDDEQVSSIPVLESLRAAATKT
jgi:5-formyltetrahydrofolate cyclo-ligase